LPVPDPANGPAGDPFFYMPYQASAVKEEKPSVSGQAETTAQAGAQTSPSAASKPSIQPGAKPRAALLGGFKK
jgi:hypothetical protein